MIKLKANKTWTTRSKDIEHNMNYMNVFKWSRNDSSL
jgi:hypothetical protein